ncbi:MAG: hypothetical protein KGI29_09370 [Pseudomonadota bacterium]|nr:hypothetical protein [Pseudomonadota bacterium]MDE3036960.1 hypothetical protein [Pseudomonadota bacterium]
MSAPTSNQNGTTSALVVGTETTIGSTISSAGTYQLNLNVSNLVGGGTPDILEIRVYSKVLSGDTKALKDIWTLVGTQVVPILYTPVYPETNYLEFTLKQTQGTGRTFKYNVVQLA